MTTPEPVRALLADMWSDAWGEGLWAAGWRKSLEGLTAEQAAWTPRNAPGVEGARHSIWQIVLHMCFWREDALRRLADASKPSDSTLAAENYPEIREATEAGWAAARARFEETQRRVGEALARPETDSHRLRYLIPHDCYHFGQVNLIRAMLGLKPIE